MSFFTGNINIIWNTCYVTQRSSRRYVRTCTKYYILFKRM